MVREPGLAPPYFSSARDASVRALAHSLGPAAPPLGRDSCNNASQGCLTQSCRNAVANAHPQHHAHGALSMSSTGQSPTFSERAAAVSPTSYSAPEVPPTACATLAARAAQVALASFRGYLLTMSARIDLAPCATVSPQSPSPTCRKQDNHLTEQGALGPAAVQLPMHLAIQRVTFQATIAMWYLHMASQRRTLASRALSWSAAAMRAFAAATMAASREAPAGLSSCGLEGAGALASAIIGTSKSNRGSPNFSLQIEACIRPYYLLITLAESQTV